MFSPVRRVRYNVETTRVGQRTDYDKLVIEVWTDGRITPEDAMVQSTNILRHHLDVFCDYDKDMVIEFEEAKEAVSAEAARDPVSAGQAPALDYRTRRNQRRFSATCQSVGRLSVRIGDGCLGLLGLG